MGRMKNTIPENYSCIHYLDVDDCMECQYSMRTHHIAEWRRPTLKEWFNNMKARFRRW